jgi:glycosyltransferase involved in cell wall biosynthesis
MTGPAEPTVDVIITCYNQARFIDQAIESVLAQTYPHVRVTVIDDESQDETPTLVARYGERLRYVRKKNAGVAAARNSGILAASGEFVLFLDGDDYMAADALERHVDAARANPTAAVFYSAFQRVDEAGHLLGGVEYPTLEDDAFHALLTGNPFPCPVCLMVRRAAFANAGIFEGAHGAEDWDMWLRLAVSGCRFVAVRAALAMYRCHSSNASRNGRRMWTTSLTVLRKSGRYHRNCSLCRNGIARGMANVRGWCFYLLTEEIEASIDRGETWATLCELARWQMRTPCLPGAFIRKAPWYLLRSALRQMRGRTAKRTQTC